MSENQQQPANISFSDIEEDIEHGIGGQAENSLRETFAKNKVEIGLFALAVAYIAYHAWYAIELPYPRVRHSIAHLGLTLIFWAGYRTAKLDEPLGADRLKTVAYFVYMVLSAGTSYYIFTNYSEILLRAGRYTDTDIAVGAVVLVLVMIALWFVSRLIFAIAIGGFIYALFGAHLPGILGHHGLGLERTITMLTVEFDGLYGVINQVVATWVVPFILLAGFFEAMGGMASAIKGITKYVARRSYIQVGQIAVFTSMIFGSINGTTLANIASTGSVTIPLMKQNDYPPRLAAAIESVASTGGQTLPPVMGTAAFLMAELIAPSYSAIVVAAVVPAFIFYFAIAASIWVYSDELGFRQKTITDLPEKSSRRSQLAAYSRQYDFALALVVLLYWLVYVRADPMLAGMYSLLVMVGLRLVRRLHNSINPRSESTTRARSSKLKKEVTAFVREVSFGSRNSVETMVQISILVIPLGIVIRSLVVTGFAQSLSNVLINAAGGNEILIVLFAAIGAIIFGLGMPTLVAYLLVAMFIAPTMTQVLTAGQLEIHMFVFYYALVSAITPPVAIGILVAQGIAGSRFLPTAIVALKIGYPFYVLPILFLYQDILGTGSVVYLTAFLVLIGFITLSVALIAASRFSYVTRLAIASLAVPLLFAPWLPVKLLLAGALLALFGLLYREQLLVFANRRLAPK